MKKFIVKAVAKLALKAAKTSANTTCACFAYQQKLPVSAKKLRKF